MEPLTATYPCASCGSINETLVDPSAGDRQSYTEDCAVCCRPNLLHISLPSDPDSNIEINAEFDE
jgi:hypothetical protein